MKVLFLDIDGVLNSDTYAKKYRKDKLQDLGYHIFVDPAAVELVRELCETNDVKIILSSSWRGFNLESTIKDLNSYRDLRPLLKYIIGITPRSVEGIRGKEIERLLNDWNHYVDTGLIHSNYRNRGTLFQYAIIDDDCDILPSQKGHFVQTDWFEGVTAEDIERLREVLK